MTKFELSVVQQFLASRIGRQQHLETVVQCESVDMVGTNSPSGAITRFEHRNRVSRLGKLDGAGETGKARTDNDHVERVASRYV